jgi:integrase
MKTKLTDTVASRATLPAGKTDMIIWDDKLTGFGLRLREASGGLSKRWLVMYKDALNKACKAPLGTTAETTATEAREAARKMLGGIARGIYPHVEAAERTKSAELQRDRAGQTFGVLIHEYLDTRAKKLQPNTLTEVTRYLTQHWAPFRRLPVHDIKQGAIKVRLKEITEKSGDAAGNRARTALVSFFVWAMKQDIGLMQNPAANTEANVERSRDRVLSMDELIAIWGACEDDDHGRIVRLLALTGQRAGEVGGLRWSEINGDTWTLPVGRAKNKQSNLIPLVPAALALLPERGTKDTVFGQGANGYNNFGEAKRALDARIKAAGQRLKPWVLHDLRRSYSTHLNGLGVEPHVVEALLNHVGRQDKVARVYNRCSYEAQRRDAAKLWADHLMGFINGRKALRRVA